MTAWELESYKIWTEGFLRQEAADGKWHKSMGVECIKKKGFKIAMMVDEVDRDLVLCLLIDDGKSKVEEFLIRDYPAVRKHLDRIIRSK
jgi:hypothetical protein